MLKKILIIGGSGLVGSTLAQYASTSCQMHLTYNENKPEHDGIQYSKIDLLKDRREVTELIEKMRPTAVVHTAAYGNVDFCESNQKLAELLHIDVVKYIATACKNVGAKLISFSTDAVFDGRLKRKYTEEDITNPISYYAKTKLDSEDIVLSTSVSNVVLRTTVIYGWHKRSRFTNWVFDGIRNNKEVCAFIDQHNTPTLVDDLAKAILKIIEMNVSGLYHAVGKTCLSRYDFALMLATKFGFNKDLIKPTPSAQKNQLARRPSNGCLDATKLEKSIGYNFCNIETGISFMLEKSRLNVGKF